MREWLIFLYPYFLGVIEVLIEYFFFSRFLRKKRLPVYYEIFILTGLAIASLCHADNMIKFIVCVILFMLGGFWMEKAAIGTALLYGIVTVEVMHLCYGISDFLLSVLAGMVFRLNAQSAGYLFMGAGGVVPLVLSVLCYLIIEKYFVNAETERGKYTLMILTPVLLIFGVSEYINREFYGNTVIFDPDGSTLLPLPAFPVLFMQCMGITSLFCILYAYKKIGKNFCLSRQVSLLEQETDLLNQYAEEAKARFEQTRSFRHDVKNHMMVIRELLLDNRRGAALKYMGAMETILSDISFPVNTNNPVLDILLQNKLGIAAGRQIEVECSLTVPYPSAIDDIDFCIVLSNALDNAITACGQIEQGMRKFIHITGKQQGSFLLIEISNSYTGKKAVDRGTGIANIKAAAEKYGGAINIQTEENVFSLSILFIIPQHVDDISRRSD